MTETNASPGCPLCELGMSQLLTPVSRHRTQEGTVVYARCDCGRLSAWLEPTTQTRPRQWWGQPQTCGG
ncbi:hypothetical protein FB566_2487 [Stackebrandtia endophytica]|uniref:Ogr/Delta-like zinc finger protein n=1 Tax=Stackebrandtia endophytica TaxID=1496996 RepID=A0A543AWJ0_9ACTN|nr:hypothetical protein [Stackebrandtia endophytica]TQL76943.1 hypothetical protein FB566_2487 [Stackebrandtia endophytica]